MSRHLLQNLIITVRIQKSPKRPASVQPNQATSQGLGRFGHIGLFKMIVEVKKLFDVYPVADETVCVAE